MTNTAIEALKIAVLVLFVLINFISYTAYSSENNAHSQDNYKKIISINICSDILLYHLAPSKIASLSFLSVDETYSPIAQMVKDDNIKLNHARASEILLSEADLVLASQYTPRQKINFIESLGIDVYQLGIANDFDQIKNEIRNLANFIQQSNEGQKLIQKIDEDLTAINYLSNKKPTMVSLSPNKFVMGKDSLVNEVIVKSGFANKGGQIISGYWAKQSVESLILMQPDYWLMDVENRLDYNNLNSQFDLATKSINHQALLKYMTNDNTIYMPSSLLSCYGPHTTQAMKYLNQTLQHISR